MRVLVTGGNRYIGLSLVAELVNRGHEVTVVNSHEARLPESVRRIDCDRKHPGALTTALAAYRDAFDVVYDHTAYTLQDMEPLVDLFRGRVQHFFFTSSQAVYRTSPVQPLREGAPRYAPGAAGNNPLIAYGIEKARCENRLFDLWREERFPATILRVSHTLGPRSPAVTRDPGFFARIESGRPIPVPGEGHAMVSLVHIDDAAALMGAMIGNQAVKGEAYNVTGTEASSIAGVIELIGRAMGKPVEILKVPMADARAMWPPVIHWFEAVTGPALVSPGKALRDVDWKPRFGLESGYRDSYDWFVRGGRDQYAFDFSRDDELIAKYHRPV